MDGASSTKRWLMGACLAAGLIVPGFIVTAADAQRGGGRDPPPALPTGGPIYTAPSPALDISGVWWTESYSPKIQVVGGGESSPHRRWQGRNTPRTWRA